MIPATIAPNGVNCNTTPKCFNVSPFFNNPAANAPANARIAPTERSIPPVRMISVIPMDRHRFTEICSRIFRWFAIVRNLSDSSVIATSITKSAMSGCSFLISSLVFMAFWTPSGSESPSTASSPTIHHPPLRTR